MGAQRLAAQRRPDRSPRSWLTRRNVLWSWSQDGLDFLPDPPFEALEAGALSVPGVRLGQTQQLRTIFLGMDQASAELRSSDVKGRNPFKDKRVRQALYQAIDIEAIRDEIMHGLSIPAGMLIEPGINGYRRSWTGACRTIRRRPGPCLRKPAIRKASASPSTVTNNSYINDEAICRAVADQLGDGRHRGDRSRQGPSTSIYPRLMNRQSGLRHRGLGRLDNGFDQPLRLPLPQPGLVEHHGLRRSQGGGADRHDSETEISSLGPRCADRAGLAASCSTTSSTCRCTTKFWYGRCATTSIFRSTPTTARSSAKRGFR